MSDTEIGAGIDKWVEQLKGKAARAAENALQREIQVGKLRTRLEDAEEANRETVRRLQVKKAEIAELRNELRRKEKEYKTGLAARDAEIPRLQARFEERDNSEQENERRAELQRQLLVKEQTYTKDMAEKDAEIARLRRRNQERDNSEPENGRLADLQRRFHDGKRMHMEDMAGKDARIEQFCGLLRARQDQHARNDNTAELRGRIEELESTLQIQREESTRIASRAEHNATNLAARNTSIREIAYKLISISPEFHLDASALNQAINDPVGKFPSTPIPSLCHSLSSTHPIILNQPTN